MFETQLSILFLIFYVQNSSCFHQDPWALVGRLRKVMDSISKIDTTGSSGESFIESFVSPRSTHLSDEFLSILTELEVDHITALSALKELLVELKYDTAMLQKSNEIEESMREVDTRYFRFHRFLMRMKSRYFSDRQSQFRLYIDPSNILRHRPTVKAALDNIRKLVMPPSNTSWMNDGLFTSITDHAINTRRGQCNNTDQITIPLTDFYKSLMLTEMRAQLIIAFANGYGNATVGVSQPRTEDSTIDLKQQFIKYTKALSSSLKALQSAYSESCNVRRAPLIQDKYFEMSGIFEEIVFQYDGDSCDMSCWNMLTHVNVQKCGTKWVNPQAKCVGGQVTSCAWLGHSKMCLGKTPFRRHFEYVESSEQGFLGQEKDCSGPDFELVTISSLNGSLSTCHCHCMNSGWRIHIFPVQSRIKDNYVIVGVRFVQDYGFLFLQVAEGKLGNNGYISDFSWIPVERTYDSSIPIGREVHFFFDDLLLQPDHVVTGIQLRETKRGFPNKIRGFSITISGVPFDYASGELDLTAERKEVVSGPLNKIQKELPYRQVNPIFTDKTNSTQRSSQQYTYVKLQQSELNVDFGQSTLPLFDSTPVSAENVAPFRGIDIFHRGSNRHAGFISVRGHPYDYLQDVDNFIARLENNATD